MNGTGLPGEKGDLAEHKQYGKRKAALFSLDRNGFQRHVHAADPSVLLRKASLLARVLGVWAPLVAALIAPVATLYDIPALSQKWYSYNGQTLSDPSASLILSSISLALSIIANTLLVVRFTVQADLVSGTAAIGSTRQP